MRTAGKSEAAIVQFIIAPSVHGTTMAALGGGAQSKLWVKMIATALNIPIQLPEAGDYGAALGAARLAKCAALQLDPEAEMIPPEVSETILPDEALVPAFNDSYARYKKLYPVMKALQ